ncbi:hypothetical protein, partial [Bacillus cereus group sp. Bce002]|uniref:hypothetical protein n=1 Tax=Bacillus cereus group sp. Bce002 TaxID=3445259 RepID=UPI003F6A1D61
STHSRMSAHSRGLSNCGSLHTALFSGSTSDIAVKWVESHYHLSSADDMQEFLTFMLEAGDRQEYQTNYAPYTLNPERLAAEIA